MTTDPIKVSYDGLDGLKRQLLQLGIALDNAASSATSPGGQLVTAGAGELSGELGESVTRWTTGWGLWLTAVSDDASIVGNSVGQASIDFSAVDAAGSMSHDVVL